MVELGFAEIGILLVVASFVAIISRRVGLPYTAGLVLAGIGLAFFPSGSEIPLSRELVFNVFLPPLIFEAAMQLHWQKFRKQLPLTGVLAFLGVVISAAVVASGMHWFLDWTWLGAAFFGTLIAATDPVSVIAAFKEMGAEPRLAMIVESESLLNDGVAAVGFSLFLGIASGGHISVEGALGSLSWTVFGGIAIGGAVALTVLGIAGRTTDHLVEVTLTTIVAWGGFLVAEHFHASGVFAALSAGLIVGNIGWQGSISPEGRRHITDFWEYAAFLANSCLFLLIGTHEAHQPIGFASSALVIAILLTLFARGASVYPLAMLFRGSSLRVPVTFQHILVWGGLRGAVGLALALAVPASVPERHAIIVLAFGVVGFSIFVQGLSIPFLLRWWHLITPSNRI